MTIYPEAVVSWRRRQLVRAGFADAVASRLAVTPGVDLHALLSLVDRGCSPALAVRIMAPAPGSDSQRVSG